MIECLNQRMDPKEALKRIYKKGYQAVLINTELFAHKTSMSENL